MPVYKRKGAKHWFVKFDLDGKTYWRTCKTARTKAQAERVEVQMKEAVFNGTYKPVEHGPRIKDFIHDTYLPWARKNKTRNGAEDETYCRLIEAEFGRLRLAELTPKMIRAFQTKRSETPTQYGTSRKPATVKRELSVLSRLLTLAVQHEYLTINPYRLVEQPTSNEHRLRWLSEDEETRLLAACTGQRAHLRAIILIAIHTGMRRGEMLGLRRYQLNFETNTITLTHTKTTKRTGKGRVIPLNSVARGELFALAENLGELEYLFRLPGRQQPLHFIKNGFHAACDQAKIEGLRFHDLRHTFGTRLAEAGEPLHRIAELMGHGDIRMTMRYVHAIAAGKHQAVERLVTSNRCRIVADERERIA